MFLRPLVKENCGEKFLHKLKTKSQATAKTYAKQISEPQKSNDLKKKIFLFKIKNLLCMTRKSNQKLDVG